MTERGYRVKSDANKAGWEESDFPILCETCLGENPYVRMMKEPAGRACKICERPFTVFRWKPGPRARFKKTEVCQMCAKLKNVCQTCVLDLTYGLPVQVRDAFLAKASAHNMSALAVPDSNVGRAYQHQQHQAMLANGQAAAARDEALHQGLLRMVRKRPKYERNLPHLCSFYARGECNRGSECPYRHEMPRPKDDLSKQNIVDRFHGRNDPVAKRMLARSKGKAQFAHPPTPQAKTLWLAPINATTTQSDIQDKFYAYGEILSIKLIPDKSCAFVEYATQAQAVEACKALYASLDLNGVPTKVAWAHPPRPRGAPPQLTAGTAAPGTGVVIPPPPPRKGAAAKASTRGAASGAGAGAGTGAGNSAAGAGASTPSAPTAPAAAPTAVQFPAYMLKAMPAPPGLRPGMKVPPPPKGVPAYAGVIPPPPPRKKSSGPVRREKSKVARTQAHPYASMDPRAMGSRVNMT